MADDPFAKYRAQREEFDVQRWPEAFSAQVRAAVETEAEAAAGAAYYAVRRAAELADEFGGSVQGTAENARGEVERVAFEMVRDAEGGES